MKAMLLFLVLLGYLTTAQQRDIPDGVTGDPVAIFLYGEMIGVLHGAESLVFDCKSSFYSIKEGKENFRQDNNFKAWLMKPNFARLEVTWPNVGPMGTLVGDGDYFWLFWPEGTTFFTSAYRNRPGEKEYKVYMKKRTPVGRHSLAHEIGYIGNGSMCILELSAFHGYVESMTPYLGAITSKGEEMVGEELCDVVHLSFMKGQRERILWLSKKDRLPRKLKSIVHVAYDIFSEEEWSNIRLNKKLDPALFQWTPPEGWEERSMPDPDDALLSKGQEAPAFSLRDAKDGKIALSDYAGKPVWLMFWRVG
jgi:outer membrane lipoprotein-sorting protein